MASVRDPDDVVQLLQRSLLGETIDLVEVTAANALKTVDPPLDALSGRTVDDVTYDEGQPLRIACGEHVLEIDLARTGAIEYSPDLAPWKPSGRAIAPTGRLILRSGAGIDFKEPARTKRITFALRNLDPGPG